MGQHTRRETLSGPYPTAVRSDVGDNLDADLVWPFGKLHGIDRDDVRETAYEIFFTACRSSPGFGGRNSLTFYSAHNHDGNNSSNNNNNGGESNSGTTSMSMSMSSKPNGVVMTPTSRVKRALGLKMLKRSPSRRMVSGGSGSGSTPSSPSSYSHNRNDGSNSVGGSPSSLSFTIPASRPRRPMTSAEIMRQQMRVTEQSDNRLRKTLMRTLVGQVRLFIMKLYKIFYFLIIYICLFLYWGRWEGEQRQ